MMKSYISKYAKGNVKGALLLSAALALSANLQAQDLRGQSTSHGSRDFRFG